MDEGIDRHLLDSLAGLTLPEIAVAERAVDIGSGAGFPGIALAIARPGLAVTLVESEHRKADWLARASAAVPNLRVVADRSEHLAGTERERYPLATMRALGPLAGLPGARRPARRGGRARWWSGAATTPTPSWSAPAAEAAAELGLEPAPPVAVTPFPGARRRLHAFRKASPTPRRYPRRAGRAAKRPLGGWRG